MDFPRDWTSVLEWLKRPFFAFATTIILCILLISNEILTWLGLGDFRWIVGILFVLSLCVFLSQVLAAAWAAICWWKRIRRALTNHRNRLHQLSRDEKLALKGYIDGQARTQYFNINDGIAAGLEEAGIIYRASTVSTGMFRFPYNIEDFAWDYLNKYPGILTGS